MSRPIKQGLDYFAMDVNMDEKVELIEAKYYCAGFCVLVKMYQKIYKESYYANWNEQTALLFSKRINVDIKQVNAIIKDCIKYNLFDAELYKKYEILTSKGIQKRYLLAIARRKNITLDKRFIIVDINEVNADINWINDAITPINDDTGTQSKVKETKLKESMCTYDKFYEAELSKNGDVNYKAFVEFLFGKNGIDPRFDYVLGLGDQIGYEQYKKIKIVAEENGKGIFDTIRELENKKIKKYTSFYLTLNNWLKQKYNVR